MSPHPGFAHALLDPSATAPPQLRTWNNSDPTPRFDVHRNNVVSSLVRALEESFPVTCMLVGDAFFRAMAREYVRAQPPDSPVLLEYGASFASFIDGFAPAASVPYLADMARLERARVEAFHAADAEVLAPGQFVSWLEQPERLMHCRVCLHPSLRVLPRQREVLALWLAHQPGHEAGRDAALDAAAGEVREDVLVLRPALQVQARVLPAGVATTLTALAAQSTLGEALERGAGCPGFELDAAIAVLVHGGAAVALQAADAWRPLL